MPMVLRKHRQVHQVQPEDHHGQLADFLQGEPRHPPARVASIPWDILVASSALIAVDAIEDKSLHQDSLLLPTGFSDGFLDAILSPLQPRPHLDYIGSPSDHWKTIKRIRSKYQPRTQSVNKPDGTPYLKSEKSQILAQHLR